MKEKKYMEVEISEVYQRLWRLHMEICELTHEWPKEESYDLKSRMTQSSKVRLLIFLIKIISDIPVDLPRPRKRSDAAYGSLIMSLLEMLEPQAK